MIEPEQCVWCLERLGNSPSDDFCSEMCERYWLQEHNGIEQLPGHRMGITSWWAGWGQA